MVVIAIGVMSCECQVRPSTSKQVIRVRHFAAKRVILIKDYEGT